MKAVNTSRANDTRDMGAHFARLVLAFLFALIPGWACATYVFTTIDYPGAVFTDVRGLNNVGQIVGYASTGGISTFAFLYSVGLTQLPRAPRAASCAIPAPAQFQGSSSTVVPLVLAASTTTDWWRAS